jgi:hypothetical protein
MKILKTIDDFDFVFINKPLTQKEDKEFSDFLKERQTTSIKRKVLLPTKRNKKSLLKAKPTLA